MKIALGAAAFLVIWGLGGESVNFDGLKPGAAPPHWTFVSSHPTDRARWQIRFDPSAPSRGNILGKDVGGIAEGDFPMAIFDKVVCGDGDLTVKFRIDGGGRTKTAGVVWRYTDPENYYLLHFSADQKNIMLFRVKDGRIEPIEVTSGRRRTTAITRDIGVGQWYIAKVSFRGDRIRAFFGYRELFDATDSSLMNPGKTGVWTRGRTTASFDDFRIDRKN
ncbi:MAG: hypothetical protein KGN84_01710 [Acidobacteriota bacterium]|nr:hypothetical protein [Acidobacteriota bacterium]